MFKGKIEESSSFPRPGMAKGQDAYRNAITLFEPGFTSYHPWQISHLYSSACLRFYGHVARPLQRIPPTEFCVVGIRGAAFVVASGGVLTVGFYGYDELSVCLGNGHTEAEELPS